MQNAIFVMTSDLFSLGRLLTQRELATGTLLATYTKMMAWRTARFGNDLGMLGQVQAGEEGGCWWGADSTGEGGKQPFSSMPLTRDSEHTLPQAVREAPLHSLARCKVMQGHCTEGRERRKLRSHLHEWKAILLNIWILQCSVSAVQLILTSLFWGSRDTFCFSGTMAKSGELH